MRTSILSVVACAVALFASTAMADTIANRFGFTGRLGAAFPLENDFINGTTDTKAGFASQLGVIYGFGDHLAMDVEFSYLPKLDVHLGGVKAYEATINDFSIGLQYRIAPKNTVVPYIGVGADFIKGGLKHLNGTGYSLDWTYGGHANVGFDWFLTRGVALNADLRGTVAASGDVMSGSTNVGDYDPAWLQATFGVRLILPEKF